MADSGSQSSMYPDVLAFSCYSHQLLLSLNTAMISDIISMETYLSCSHAGLKCGLVQAIQTIFSTGKETRSFGLGYRYLQRFY